MPGPLDHLSEICLALPEAEREDSGRHAGFRVRGRTFAYFLVDHQGNERITGLVCKAPPGESGALIDNDPERYYSPAYLHHRLDRLPARHGRGRLAAPKRLAAQVTRP
jgi:hypothetical protein